MALDNDRNGAKNDIGQVLLANVITGLNKLSFLINIHLIADKTKKNNTGKSGVSGRPV